MDIQDEQRDFAEERANLLIMHEECEGCETCAPSDDSDKWGEAYEAYLRDNPDASYIPGVSYQAWLNAANPDSAGITVKSVNSDIADSTGEEPEPCQNGEECPGCNYLDILFQTAALGTSDPDWSNTGKSDMSVKPWQDDTDYEVTDISPDCGQDGCNCYDSDIPDEDGIEDKDDSWDTPAVRGMWS